MRYQFERGTRSNVFGSTSLPSEATGSTTSEHAVQISDSQIINEHIVNETRFQLRLEPSLDNAVSTAPSVSVGGYFSQGGAATQFSNDNLTHLELQNVTTMSAGPHAIKLGLWARDNRDAITTSEGFQRQLQLPIAQRLCCYAERDGARPDDCADRGELPCAGCVHSKPA